MKKTLLTVAIVSCIGFAGSSVALTNDASSAKRIAQHSAKDMMRELKGLDLTDEQKQQIKSVIKTTAENNSVYSEERRDIRSQMRDLMTMPSWDAANAETIIRTQMQQAQTIELNRAKARHEIYNLLTSEQQNELAEKKAKRQAKMETKRANGNAGKNGKRRGGEAKLAKALRLSDEQKAEIKAIRQNAKQEMQDYMSLSKAHKEALQAIIQAPVFDESAWLAQQAAFEDTKVAVRLAQSKVRYDSLALLDEDQKVKFEKIMKKMKGKRS